MYVVQVVCGWVGVICVHVRDWGRLCVSLILNFMHSCIPSVAFNI